VAAEAQAHARPVDTAYRPDIDGLRAIAVIPVVLFHAGVSLFTGGYVGVDVFFVISGYVISKSLLSDIHQGRFSISKFYERRVRRIFPALMATFAVTWLLAWLLFLPSYFIDYSKSLFSSSLFFSNMYFWKYSGYFANGAELRPLLHTWSLSVEEQYYVVAPIALYLIARFCRSRWLMVLGPAALASLALSIWAAKNGPTANFFLLPTRAWELLLGAMLALRPPPPLPHPFLKQALGLIGVALIAAAVFLYDSGTPFPGWTALPPCLGAAALIYVGSDAKQGSQAWATRALALKPLVWVGLISYSLYLVHWPIAAFTRYVQLRDPDPPTVAFIVLLSLVLAWLSWRFVEQPFRRPAKPLPRPALLATGVAAMLVVAGFGAAGATARVAARDSGFKELAAKESGALWGEGTCFLENNPDPALWNAARCTVVDNGPETVLLWGDSYAAHYVPGFAALRAEVPYRVLQYTAAGCPPAVSSNAPARPKCSDFNRNALDVIRREHVTKVILAGRWADLQRRGLGELRSTIEALSGMGVQTYVVGQSPIFPADVQVIASRKTGVDAWPIDLDPSLNARLARLSAGARFIDPLPRLCDGEVCAFREDGRLLYADDGHFTSFGSRRAVAALLPLLR
jgi:peptidoglycan/LPS O-acetylase OafA/YrhL